MARKSTANGKAKVEPPSKPEPVLARKVAPSVPDPPPPPNATPQVVVADPHISAVPADTDVPLPVPPPRSPQSRSPYPPARQVAWADHADPSHEPDTARLDERSEHSDDMYVQDPGFHVGIRYPDDTQWNAEATEKREDEIRNYDPHTAWPDTPGGSQHHDDWDQWKQGRAEQESLEGSSGRAQDHSDWGSSGGSAQSAPPAAPAHPLPSPPSEHGNADDWRTAREQIGMKGFSRASGKPASPPPNSARQSTPAAALLSHMAQTQRYTQAAISAQRQGRPPPPQQQHRIQQQHRVPMPQPNPYGGAPSIMSRGRTISGGTSGRGDWMPPSTSAPRAPGPSGAAHLPSDPPPPTRSMTFPMPGGAAAKGDPKAYPAWMSWASEAGNFPKVATTIAANIPQPPPPPPPGMGGRYPHPQQQQLHPQMPTHTQVDGFASLYGRFGQVHDQAKSVSFQTQPAQMRPGGPPRSQTIPGVHHQQDDWGWDGGGGGAGGSVHGQSETWGGGGGRETAVDSWGDPTGGNDRWGVGHGDVGGSGNQRGSSKKGQDDWAAPSTSHWGQPQDDRWGDGGGADDRWGDPQPSGGGWGTAPPASTSKVERKSKQQPHGEPSSHRAPDLQQGDSWGSTWGRVDGGGAAGVGGGGGHRGGGEWSAIPEEDEEEEEEDYYDEEWDDLGEEEENGWHENSGRHDRHGHRVRRSDISYQLQSPNEDFAQSQRHQFPPAPLLDPAQVQEYMHLDPNTSSKTMNMATGRAPTTASFEFKLPRHGENAFHTSNGEALKPAQRAMYGRSRKARERIHWCFAPDKDERVSGLLKWIDSMSNGLAAVGLQYFLRSGQRGALIANARYHSTDPDPQPAFDWVRKEQLQPTLDRVFQESVVTYHPTKVVVVFVFLLSESGNSMACWRRKVPVPVELRAMYERDIEHILDGLEDKRQVFVDELPPKPNEPPLPQKKKKRGFWRRLFGLK